MAGSASSRGNKCFFITFDILDRQIVIFFCLPRAICRESATLSNSCFYFREGKDDNKVILEDKDLEVIGSPSIFYDDCAVIAQHIDSGLWLSYKVP